MNEGIDLREVLDGIFAYVAILSPDGVVLEINRAPLEPAGLRREDVIGQPFVETYWLSSMPESQAQMRRALEAAARGEIVREDFEVRITDDRPGTVDGLITPLKNEAGEIHRLVASGIDITERKRAEKALRLTEERFQQIAESIHEVFWLSNPNTGEVLYISPGYKRSGAAPTTLCWRRSATGSTRSIQRIAHVWSTFARRHRCTASPSRSTASSARTETSGGFAIAGVLYDTGAHGSR